MSKISELYLDIELMLEQGTHPATISAVLEVPASWVYEVVEQSGAAGKNANISPFDLVFS